MSTKRSKVIDPQVPYLFIELMLHRNIRLDGVYE